MQKAQNVDPQKRCMVRQATTDRGVRTFTTRCHRTVTAPARDAMPQELTGWESEVTCPDCALR